MGNFQHLAERILTKKTSYVVSSFHPLGKETGNLAPINRNSTGNFKATQNAKTRLLPGVSQETLEETTRKPQSKQQETKTTNIVEISFPRTRTCTELFTCFFNIAQQCGLDLLHEDKRWLQDICFDERLSVIQTLLTSYIKEWLSAMNEEPITYRQQNAGRYRANNHLRLMLSRAVNKLGASVANSVAKTPALTSSTRGRPSTYSQALADEICHAIAATNKGTKRLCKEHDHWPSQDTIYTWLKTNKDFSEQYARAKKIQVDTLMDEIMDIAENPHHYVKTLNGANLTKEEIERLRLMIDTRKWIVCKLFLKVYGNC